MQEGRRTNRERSETTRAALIAEARALFVTNGYADTSTPQVAAAAGLSRGALYHQFADKQALLQAVLAAEAQAVEASIASTPVELDGTQALVAGARLYIEAMRVPGRTRLLLVDGPAVLGVEAMQALDAATSGRALLEGLKAARPDAPPESLVVLADLLAAAFDRAALSIEAGGASGLYEATVEALMLSALALVS